MYKSLLGLIVLLLLCPSLWAQTPELRNTAANSIQASPAETTAMVREIKIPAGTSLDIEVMRTVSSLDARVGDFVSFRVLIPVKVDDAIVIGSGALVSGRLVRAKRAGHWGKAGK